MAMPPAPALAGDEVHVWTVSLLDGASGGTAAAAESLSGDEHERAARFHFERDRRRYMLGRAALRRVLACYVNDDAARLRFAYGAYGKPALVPGARAAAQAPAFNASHTQDLMLIAVADGPALGVDLEALRPLQDLDGLARQVCSAAEHRELLALAPAQQLAGFLRCWTRKEAYLKALGTGLSLPPVQVHVGCGASPAPPAGWWLHDLRPAPGWAAALAAPGAPRRIVHLDFHAHFGGCGSTT
ncbi:4'-phosphopantetheinyl transferase family protein [Azohydromonas aeria]|uniref:4'-phosphopantetheinyl transferase family protein n=1 Tax=Azohydromonas aeria TaxID=2590212 RepID=UPI0012FB046B|nr:4'-phosphopantetheinyl transferase superfamily protein [Azohydromonas aeria]